MELWDAEPVTLYDGLENYLKDRDRSCFFTGHRHIPLADRPRVTDMLKVSVLYLYNVLGVRTFHAGGALGFDTLAASVTFDVRREKPDIRLVLDLPYTTQAKGWSEADSKIYRYILANADEVRYAYKDGDPGDHATARKYLLMRNRRMCESSRYGLAYYTGARGGTSYTFAYALEHGCEVFNLYDEMMKRA